MKWTLFFLLLILFSFNSFGQFREFEIYENGLIYNEKTMSLLGQIVDSLHHKFQTCETDKTYYSKYQARAAYIDLENGDIKAAKKDIESNISFEEFIIKYPKAVYKEELLVLKYHDKDYKGKDIVEFQNIPLKYRDRYQIQVLEKPELYQPPLKGQWVFEHWKGGSYSSESLRGFYFLTEFEKQPLPARYARLIQYSDCLIDTTGRIFKKDAKRKEFPDFTKPPQAVIEFMEYVDKKTNKPQQGERDQFEFLNELRAWDSIRISIVDNTISKEEKFHDLLKKATIAALEQGGSNEQFEEYISRYYSKKDALDLKRGRIVRGSCSADERPRLHAMNIAVLSAETLNWGIFLRAHLDIMNDRFHRTSDGSYAWGKRETYLREIEELEIEVLDLILGISFRIDNPSQNHYYGDISRLGRALSETKDLDAAELKMLEIIRDTSLDDYNRLLAYFLFKNYNSHLTDKNRSRNNITKLKKAVKELPDYLAANIDVYK